MPDTQQLNENIKDFYDRSTPLWLDVWGEHMHHGWYGPAGDPKGDHQEAQIELLRRLLDWGQIDQARHILDAGCGVGGSARFMARHFGAQVEGVTLSPVQAEQAKVYNQQAGLEKQVCIRVQDMMTLNAQKLSYDLIWSLESAEHIADKERLLQLFFQLLVPGGRLLLVTWCTRAEEEKLHPAERRLLQKIYRNYHLPPMISIDRYGELVRKLGYEDVDIADWTSSVSPFWKAVIRSVFSWNSIIGLLRAGTPAIKGAWTMRYMREGYQSGLLQFGLLRAKKPLLN